MLKSKDHATIEETFRLLDLSSQEARDRFVRLYRHSAQSGDSVEQVFVRTTADTTVEVERNAKLA